MLHKIIHELYAIDLPPNCLQLESDYHLNFVGTGCKGVSASASH